jgi:hypothetical protein
MDITIMDITIIENIVLQENPEKTSAMSDES